MKVLVACEFSGTVRDAFRSRGHDAYSCDLEEDINNSVYHIRGDVLKLLNDKWDLMIAHPPCTYLAASGARWFHMSSGCDAVERCRNYTKACEFFMQLVNAPMRYICIENPIGFMSTIYRKPDQIINPFQFGHPVPKKTCLWLKNLPKLVPTQIVEPEYANIKGKKMSKWYSNLTKKNRSRNRSITFQGIADAMADQWGNL